MLTTEHGEATCPECNAPLYFGLKREATGWKVYYECDDHCGFERMAGRVSLSKVGSREEAYDRAEAMGDRWC